MKNTILGPGQRIRQKRVALGFSQEQVAHRLGVTRGTVARWESGARGVREPMLTRLADYLDVTPAWILTGSDDAAVIPEPPTPRTVGVPKSPDAARDRLVIAADRYDGGMTSLVVHRRTADILRDLKYKTRWSMSELADALICFAAERLDIVD